MKVIATYNFRFGHGNGVELIRRGDELDPPATASMSRDDHARMLISCGAAVTTEDWANPKKAKKAVSAVKR